MNFGIYNDLFSNLERCIGGDDLVKKLAGGSELKIKLGVDPTRPDLTFGHWVVFNKLRQFQNLGHRVIFLIGDYTTRIGDPSGRSSTRPVLTNEQIEENAKTYLDQAFRVLDESKTVVRYNSEWFGKMNFGDLLAICRDFTVAQMLERDDFNKRYSERTPIAIVEFLYPLLQAYDSFVLHADVEIGGSDQLFNMCLGRDLQKIYGQSQQTVMCLPLIVGLDGVRKMSKSYGNYIAFNDSADEMLGKIMSIQDDAMWPYFKLLALENDEKIASRKLEHPMLTKKQLAKILVSKLHGEKSAEDALTRFETIFSQKNIPDEMPEFDQNILAESNNIVDVISKTNLYNNSKKELKRLISQGGVEVNGEKIVDHFAKLSANNVIRIGKKIFFKIKG